MGCTPSATCEGKAEGNYTDLKRPFSQHYVICQHGGLQEEATCDNHGQIFDPVLRQCNFGIRDGSTDLYFTSVLLMLMTTGSTDLYFMSVLLMLMTTGSTDLYFMSVLLMLMTTGSTDLYFWSVDVDDNRIHGSVFHVCPVDVDDNRIHGSVFLVCPVLFMLVTYHTSA
ncbi:hypothetical protein ACOMHN_055010 [Nucella lapillus]